MQNMEKLREEIPPPLLREFLRIALERFPERMEALRTALAGGDACQVEQEAHAFKGNCFGLILSPLAELCGTMESMARTGTLDGAAAVLEQIAATYERIRPHLEAERQRLEAA